MLLPHVRSPVLISTLSVVTGGSPVTWEVSGQIVDDKGYAVAGRYTVRVMLGATEYGHDDPDSSTSIYADGGTDSFNAIADGTIVDIETSADGSWSVACSALTDRYFTAAAWGSPAVSSGLLSASVVGDRLLLRTGDFVLLRTGDFLLLR